MKLSELSTILNATLHGNDAEFSNVTIDSRSIKSGDCFFAIKGEFFDGHDFIADIAKKNAAVAIIDRDISTIIPTIHVKNTRAALMDLARYYRDSVHIPVVAITGSCGKTTTRALLENILKQAGSVLASQKSFNNDIGLPLTLLQLKPDHDFAVLEVGTNHPGEIVALTEIAKPTVAVITMVAAVHVEGFGSVDNIAKEKGDIYATLETTGIAVINADDSFAAYWKKLNGNHRVVTFGQNNTADVMATDIEIMPNGCTQFNLTINNGGQKHLSNSTEARAVACAQTEMIHLPLLGQHNITNALAAAAVAFSLEIPIDLIKVGLETVTSEYGRLNIKKGLKGATIIDDSYNANPASVKAAIDLLTRRSDHAILVLGDMKELGEHAQEMHTTIGLYARDAGVKQLLCYGVQTALTANAFGKNALHFDSQEKLIEALKLSLSNQVTVLVKGSNSMKMKNVVNAIVE